MQQIAILTTAAMLLKFAIDNFIIQYAGAGAYYVLELQSQNAYQFIVIIHAVIHS